jgi:hypothetical protein
MDKTSNNPGANSTSIPAQTQTEVEYASTTVRERIDPPTSSAAGAGPGTGPRMRTASAQADADEMDRLARRYSREAQLALEGALYWAIRWPFELMASLVSAGRKWEEEYYRSTPKRRVSLYEDDK